MNPALPEYDPRLAGTLLSLCGPPRESIRLPDLPADPDARRLCRLLEWHGLTPEPAAFAGAGLPPALFGEIQRASLVQHARNSRLLVQLGEVARPLSAAGVEAIVLKGSAALLWLYPGAAPRRNDDLDLLVREAGLPQACEALARLGFRQTGEEETPPAGAGRLRLTPGRHLLFERAGMFPIELHTELFEGRGDWTGAEAEVWGSSLPCEGPPVRRLSMEHFVLHAAVHQMKHVAHGTGALKGWVDLVHCLGAARVPPDYLRLRETAARWGVGEDLATVLATLAEHWELALPVDSRSRPLPLGLLVDPRAREAYQGPGYPLSEYLLDLRRAGDQRGLRARLGALLGLLFPPPEALRRRYGLAPDRALLPFYLRRPFDVIGRVARSVAAEARARWRGR